ncbi:MAG: outer membrane beta-barrel protein [Acidobacteriaceae bacterium]
MQAQTAASAPATSTALLEQQVLELRQEVAILTQRLNQLESAQHISGAADAKASSPPTHPHLPATVPSENSAIALSSSAAALAANSSAVTASTTGNAAPQITKRSPFDLPDGITLNFTVDGYYAYNFNHPLGQINQLHAYDTSSNSFTINQAAIILESAPNVAEGKRYGGRVDLQFGQATQALQDNTANELQPQVWRNLYQAYGTYIFPVGSGLSVDFGKWATSLGEECNYSKDQINYSRSFWFTFLPAYHMGLRTSYTFNPKFTAAYWLVNGVQQTVDFNSAKSQAFALTFSPAHSLTWQTNYYFGEEHPTFTQSTSNGSTISTPITPAPNGLRHIFDTYATWNATPKLSLTGEADYVIDREYSHSAPKHDIGGAAYIRYQFTPKFSLAERSEYMSDRGGLFSGMTQALKETTVTADYKVANGFLMRTEWRRDFSNQPYFNRGSLGNLSKSQSLATLGMIWWFGGKQGAW